MISLFRRRTGSWTPYRCVSSTSKRFSSTWVERISEPSNQFQVYKSRSVDPYINLSIEHHLFQKSPPGSKILFQYINHPCIVIGRNQNPWLEVNLALLNPEKGENFGDGLGKIDLVRRRSGGGTVFHDEGNVNWSVICDFTEFTRDKHAEMVVRALRSIGIERARVNERHDIVLDQGSESDGSWNPQDTHSTPFTSKELRPLKVSGSAYKMARNRALHHGTALLSSPNLNVIPHYLHSPAKPLISAKGVESVSSPVSNIGVGNEAFMNAVREHFQKQYKVKGEIEEVCVDDSALEVEEISKGVAELRSKEWTYLQTPGFTFSSSPISEHEGESSSRSRLKLEARHGAITDAEWKQPQATEANTNVSSALKKVLQGVKIHEQSDWLPLFRDIAPEPQAEEMAKFLATMFPPPERSLKTIVRS